MLINELSRESGVSIHTIRFYEKSGLLKGKQKPGVTSNKYAHYDQESLERLELIRDAKSAGFTIAEMGKLIDAWYSSKIKKAQKLLVLDEKLDAIDNRIRELKEVRKRILAFRKSVEDEAC